MKNYGGQSSNTIHSEIYIKNKSVRKVLNFNTGWLFYKGEVKSATSSDYDDHHWEKVTLPHTVQLEPKEWVSSVSYQGISWYRRHLQLDESSIGKKIFIHFEAAMINSDVWINGNHLITNHGGYLPFTVDISSFINFGENNVIAVRVDSNDDCETPPGKPQNELDFAYFGGLYRDVQMIITDKLHITDAIYANKVADGGVFITYPEVSNEKAVVRIQTNVKNDYNGVKNVHVESMLVDEENRDIVASGASDSQTIEAGLDDTFVQDVTVPKPKLWSMNHPNLYTLLIKVHDGTRYVDEYKIRVGIRRIEFTAAEGFFINNDRVFLNGVNHHEDYIYVGNAVSDSMLYRDVKQIKDGGFNFIRAGHYPHKKAFMDACDELGIAVIVPTPGWQYYTDQGEFADRSLRMTRNMVRLCRNHPSAVLWEPVLNETWYPEEFATAAYHAVHEEYPTDQAYASSDFGLPNGDIFDVVYKEAYSETKPLITREWGDANHNVYDGERSARIFGEKSLINASIHRQNSLKGDKWKDDEGKDGYWDWAGLNANERIAGYALWSYNDYNRGVVREIAYSGIVDRDRYPKFNYYWLQSQRNPNLHLENADSGPMVFIANHWLPSSPRDIDIYTNTEEIKLYINDNYIETRKPPKVQYISHPIITFHNIPWEEGELKAEGLIDGVVVATFNVTTPGKPNHLAIEFDRQGIEHLTANGSDMIIAYVSIRDSLGNIVPTANGSISLHLSGQGVLVGNGIERVKANPVLTEAGIAPAFIRSTFTPGEITLTATAPGLLPGSATIKSIHYHGEFVPGANYEGIHIIHNENVAINQPVTVSSECSDYPGSNVNDENPKSYWLPDLKDDRPWILLELQEKQNIIGSKIKWAESENPPKYLIEVSDNQEHWITVVDQSENGGMSCEQIEHFAANARYVRIMIMNSTDKNVGVVDYQIYGGIQSIENVIHAEQRANIAIGKTANASSFSPGHEPNMAIDQNDDTLWRAATYDLPQWFQVNLAKDYIVTGAQLLWGKDSTYYVYKIQVSQDDNTWYDVLDKTTTGSYYHSVDFNACKIKHFRICINDLMAGGGAEKVAIKNLEIYGDKLANTLIDVEKE